MECQKVKVIVTNTCSPPYLINSLEGKASADHARVQMFLCVLCCIVLYWEYPSRIQIQARRHLCHLLARASSMMYAAAHATHQLSTALVLWHHWSSSEQCCIVFQINYIVTAFRSTILRRPHFSQDEFWGLTCTILVPLKSAAIPILPPRRYASAGISRHRVSVCLSQAGTVPKRLNVESRKQRRVTAQDSSSLTPAVDGRPPYPMKFALKLTHTPFEHNDFDQYPPTAPQPWELA